MTLNQVAGALLVGFSFVIATIGLTFILADININFSAFKVFFTTFSIAHVFIVSSTLSGLTVLFFFAIYYVKTLEMCFSTENYSGEIRSFGRV